jgi:glycosyltransferase involved in cell wall biosynthesis
MYKKKKIAVVVPAMNEEVLLPLTLEGIPDYVDRIIVIDDGSSDKTAAIADKFSKRSKRYTAIHHQVNQGLGQSLIDGYLKSLEEEGIDYTAVMAGDNQMHPDDLHLLLDEIINRDLDYVKGNRLLQPDVIEKMPRYRLLGNSLLTILTKFATGYYYIMDPQCGYTVIKNTALAKIPIEKMKRGFGYNADILCMLNIQGCRVDDVEIRPVYGEEQSKIKLGRYIPEVSWLLVRLFFRRLWKRYIVRDFNPLVLFYGFGFLMFFFVVIPLLIRFLVLYNRYGLAPQTTLIILVFVFSFSFQSFLFAIWMDMDYNKRRNP